MQRRRADSTRRRERPQDLEFTSLWTSAVSLLSMPQPIGNREIYPIDYSARRQVLGVEGNAKSASVFTGRYRPPPGLGLLLRPGGSNILWICTDRYSGCISPVDCYILRFLCNLSSQMSATTPSDFWFPSELINKEIILSPYTIVIFIPSQWCLFIVTVIDCYVLKFFYNYLLWMTATTH